MAAKTNSEENNTRFEKKLQRRLCSFLDQNCPNDLSNVSQCLERMEKERNALEKQVVKKLLKLYFF